MAYRTANGDVVVTTDGTPLGFCALRGAGDERPERRPGVLDAGNPAEKDAVVAGTLALRAEGAGSNPDEGVPPPEGADEAGGTS